MASFFSAVLSFLSPFPLVFTVTAERCSPLRRTCVHRYGGKVFTVTTNTNDSQEKNDESLEKNVATADKNDFFAVAVAKRLQKGANEAKRSSAVHAAA